MQELKVLSVEASKSHNSVFSMNALMSLPNLRALQLKGFERIEDISALAKLTRLEILHLHGSRVDKSIDKLGELKILKVLDMHESKVLFEFPPNLIRGLVEVEELYLHHSIISRSILSELNHLPKLAALSLEVSSLWFPQDFLFPALQRYQIAINTKFSKFSRMFNLSTFWKPSVSSRLLKIGGEIYFTMNINVISELLQNVEFLEMSDVMEKDIKYLTDTTPADVPVSTILQNLKGLSMVKCVNLRVIFQVKKAGNHPLVLLSKLKFLFLEDLPDLEYIWKVHTQRISLGSLEDVRLYRCEKLNSVFSFSLAQSLVRLEVLEIYECDELEQIVEELEGDEQEISPNIDLGESLCLSKLTTLKIRDCGSLEYIFPKFMAPQGLPQLQKLEMIGLSRFKQIWRAGREREEHGIQKHFPSLTELKLDNCPELTDATIHSEWVYLEGNIQPSKLNFINTKSLTLEGIRGDDHNLIPEVDREGLNELTFLKLCYSDSVEYLVDTEKEHLPDTAFTNLVELELISMHGLKRLCNGKFPNQFLQNLEKLTVGRCDELEEVFEIDEFCYSGGQNQPKGSPPYFSLQCLKVVNIFSCQKLKSLFSASLIQSLQLLEELDISFCDELKTLFSELENGGGDTEDLFLPRLRTLEIYSCAKLEYVLPITSAEGLPRLELLEIQGCNELKTLFTELENDGGEMESSCHDLHPPCLPRLTTLRISECERLEYVLLITLAQGLPRLETVEVSECAELKQVFGVSKQQDGVEHCIKLPLLNHLELENLPNLRCFGPEHYIVKSPALKELSVYGCPQLMKCTIQEEVNNHWLHLRKNLTSDVEGLTSLGLRGCEDLECLVDTTKENQVAICVVFPNLVQLRLTNMIGLKMLCNGQPPDGFLQNIEILNVEKCMDIVSLYPVAQNLKKLIVRDCGKLQEVFGIDEFFYSRQENRESLLSNLESLRLMSVSELRWILKVPTQYVNLRNLKVLSIEKCNKLESLFSFSLIQSLRLLEELCISDCEKLEMIFAVLESDDETESSMLMFMLLAYTKSDLPRLKRLELCGLTNLSSFVPVGYHMLFPSLEVLEIKNCSQMITRFTIDLRSTVHAKTKAPRLDDISEGTSKPDINWRRNPPKYLRSYNEFTELPPSIFVEEADEI